MFMIFVGIACRKKDFDAIQKEIKKNNQCKEIQCICVQNENIENLQNIKFDAFVIHEQMSFVNNTKALEKIFSTLNFLIINTDKNKKLDILNGTRLTVITYGLNHKCTVTASSIKDDNIIVALQRDVLNKFGIVREIGEKRIEVKNNLDVYSYMLIFIIQILYCKNIEY